MLQHLFMGIKAENLVKLMAVVLQDTDLTKKKRALRHLGLEHTKSIASLPKIRLLTNLQIKGVL